MAKTYKQLMEEAHQAVPEVTVDEVKNRLERGEKWALLDVREREEYREGHLDGAQSLPRGFLEIKVESTIPDKNAPVIAYCAGGTRSLLAGKILKEMGYKNVSSMAGGYGAWKNAGFKWTQDFQYTPEQ